jgi:hypothetical protein
MAAKNQAELVEQAMEVKPQLTSVKLKLPGITTLHTKSFPEVAETLVNALKSQANVTEVRYVIGEYIELTYRT